MNSTEYLAHAPIIEAIIDIRLKTNIDADKAKSLAPLLPNGYGELMPTFLDDVGFTFSDETVKANHDRSLVGYRSDNESEKLVAQFHNNGITVSKLSPYEGWEPFKKKAQQIWEIYKSLLNEPEFSRIAVRYINKISLPFSENGFDFDHYLTNCPQVPGGMPDVLAGFIGRIVIPCEKETAIAVITSSLSAENQDPLSLILDIDVYREEYLDLNETEVWAFFDQLRTIKNTAFFGSITDKTKAIYK